MMVPWRLSATALTLTTEPAVVARAPALVLTGCALERDRAASTRCARSYSPAGDGPEG